MSGHVTHADLGGRPGFGRVVPEPEHEHFHAAWEPRALALTLAMGATGAWSLDASRAARESLPDYARLTYYAIWLGALEVLLQRHALVGADERAAGRALHPAVPVPRVLREADVPRVLAAGAPTARPATRPARFAVGDTVVTRAGAVPHHTRLPGYAAGRRGVVEAVHGMHVFADTNAHGLGEQPEWLYTVAFEGRALWPDAEAGLRVSVDAWEPYLAPCPEAAS